MEVPVRADSEHGLTPAQFAAMPAKIRQRADKVRDKDPAEAARLEADIPVWEAASKQVAGKKGKYSITWSEVERGQPEPTVKESDDWYSTEAEVAEAAAEPTDPFSTLDVVFEEIGRRNSGADLGRIQAAHDTLVSLGATCAPAAAVAEAEVDDEAPTTSITFRESGGAELVTLAEAEAVFNDQTREVWITPIRPGFGNKKDGFYYPTAAIREAVDGGLFNGLKMFANHPRKSDEKELPERSVKDWIGVIKETVWDDHKGVPRSRLKVLDRDAYDRFRDAPEHIAFSVLGQGTARPGHVEGREARIVEAVKAVKSVDWVTQGGAGGAIDFAESMSEELDMDLNDLTADQLREARPDLVALIKEDDVPPVPDPVDDDVEAADDEVEDEGEFVPEGYVPREEFEALRAEVAAMRIKEAVAEAKVEAKGIVESTLRESTLTRAAREFIEDSFREASVGEGMLYADERGLKEALEREVGRMRAVTDAAVGRRSGVRGLGAESPSERPSTLRESKEAEIAKRLGSEQMPTPRYGSENGVPATAAPISEAGTAVAAGLADRI